MARLNQDQTDTVTELMNIASGRAANALAGILKQRVQIELLDLHFLGREGMKTFLVEELGLIGSAVEQGFKGDINGSALLLLTHEHAAKMVEALLKENRDLASLTNAKQAVLGEVGNIILNACIAILCNQINKRVRFNIPNVLVNRSGAEIARELTEERNEKLEAIVLKSRMRVGEIETIVYILIVLAIHLDDWGNLLESL